MNTIFNKSISFWINNLKSEDDAYRKQRIMIISTYIGMLYSAAFIPINYNLNYILGIYVMVYLIVGFSILLIINKAYGSLVISGNLFAFLAVTGMTALIFTNSNIPIISVSVPWLIVGPVSGFLYIGKKSGIFWGIVAIIITIVVFIISGLPWDFINQIPAYKTNEHYFGAFLGLITYLMVVVVVYESEKNRFVVKLENAYNEISESHKEINQQNEEIKQQQEEILMINENLENQHNALTSAHENITTSIHVAQRIQHAILPSANLLNSLFNEHFILYKPKDIVSGDFYWATKINDYKIIAVIDCTGHGVPGAFMSLIGNNILNEIVNVNGITSPEEIIQNLDNKLGERLNQHSQNVTGKEGMDLGICVLKDLEEKVEIVFSGAKADLLYTSNSEVLKLKGNRNSVESNHEHVNKNFINHQIELEKGELICLFTDGIIDQSNSERKRFGSKKLIEFLNNNLSKPLNNQKENLNILLDNHQGVEKQRDDITVFSVKV